GGDPPAMAVEAKAAWTLRGDMVRVCDRARGGCQAARSRREGMAVVGTAAERRKLRYGCRRRMRLSWSRACSARLCRMQAHARGEWVQPGLPGAGFARALSAGRRSPAPRWC